MNKLYSVHDHWTDINKKNDVDIESIDGVITGIKVNGEDYSGGGSSDFSTAEVDVTVNGEEIFYISDVVAINEEGMYRPGSFETGTYTIVLYKGLFNGAISAVTGYKISSATGTGGVTISKDPLGRKAVNITGDGTLTVDTIRA